MVRHTVPRHLPLATGPYVAGCVDVMTEYSKDGLFARIYYPTALKNVHEHTKSWLSWLPHQEYVVGFAHVLGLYTFLIRLLMKYVAGDMKIAVVENGPLHPNLGRMKTVVFSHGMGGTRFLYSGTCCELASRGYVVIALEHRDDTASMTYFYQSEEKKLKNEPEWVKFRRLNVGGTEHFPERRKQVERRSQECSRALDLLHKLDNGEEVHNILDNDFQLSQFKDRLDFSKTVMMGHSFGGATALLTLGKDDRFRYGVILDPWMFPIRQHEDLSAKIRQPLIIINTQTFHIQPNLRELSKYADRAGEEAERFTIRHTTHENQSDTVHVIGYWLNVFMRKMDPVQASLINHNLILRFLDKHVGFQQSVAEETEKYLKQQQENLVLDLSIDGVRNAAKKIPRIW